MEKTADDYLIELFDHLIHDAQGQMYENIFHNDDITVSAPQFIIDRFRDALSRKYLFTSEASGKDLTYMGLKFRPCYQWEISVWHKNYPLYKEEWMLRKIPISSPFIEHNNAYDEYIVNIKPIIGRYVDSQNETKN